MIILYILLGLLVLLAATLLLNTWRQTRKARKLEGQHPTFTQEELDAYGEVFARMLRCATVSVKDS